MLTSTDNTKSSYYFQHSGTRQQETEQHVTLVMFTDSNQIMEEQKKSIDFNARKRTQLLHVMADRINNVRKYF